MFLWSRQRRTFWSRLDPNDDAKYDIQSAIVNRRGIYKDVYRSGVGREWSDYQLRCNFPIAMTVAPELFREDHALIALELADKILRSPLGMKTLDPADMQYRPVYNNSNDSTDPSIAKGLNYHNVCIFFPTSFMELSLLLPLEGTGVGLATWLFFACLLWLRHQSWSWERSMLQPSSSLLTDGSTTQNPMKTLYRLHGILLTLRHHIQTDPWRGIPELTNADGEYCPDSCNTQAWSASTLLDFLHDVHQLYWGNMIVGELSIIN